MPESYIKEWARGDVRDIAYWTMDSLVGAKDKLEAIILQLEAAASVLPGDEPLAEQIKQLRAHRDLLGELAETFAERLNAVSDYLAQAGIRRAAALEGENEERARRP